MNRVYAILSNNIKVKELLKDKDCYEVFYYENGTVQNVISKCEELFLTGDYALAADPMAGRLARPFSVLTLILEKNKKPGIFDWTRITDYIELDAGRRQQYEKFNEKMNEDFRYLDLSFTRTVLKI